jgi:hypothetical protein
MNAFREWMTISIAIVTFVMILKARRSRVLSRKCHNLSCQA